MPRNNASVSPSNQIMASKVTKLAGQEYCHSKVVPVPAALAANMAVIGSGETENVELVVCWQ